MGDFNRKPGETNRTGDIGTRANLIDPGKRMLSSMTPTMVLKNGKVVLLTGSPGGRTIINTVLTIVLGVTEYGLTGREAVNLPRMHHQWLPDRVSLEPAGVVTDIPKAVGDDVLDALRAMGHEVVRAAERQGDAHSIWIAARRNAVRGQRQAHGRFESVNAGSGPGPHRPRAGSTPFDSADRRAIGLLECSARATTTATITTPAPAGRSCCTRTESKTR